MPKKLDDALGFEGLKNGFDLPFRFPLAGTVPSDSASTAPVAATQSAGLASAGTVVCLPAVDRDRALGGAAPARRSADFFWATARSSSRASCAAAASRRRASSTVLPSPAVCSLKPRFCALSIAWVCCTESVSFESFFCAVARSRSDFRSLFCSAFASASSFAAAFALPSAAAPSTGTATGESSTRSSASNATFGSTATGDCARRRSGRAMSDAGA